VAFSQQADGLHIDSPVQPAGVHAYAYRIEMESADMSTEKSAAVRNKPPHVLARIGQ
jgi:hypothetical protein